MSLTKTKKSEIITDHRRSDADTGSAEVQIAVLSKRISDLTNHLKGHTKDHASRRGLIQMVNQRASLLKYLLRTAPKRHAAVLGELGLRK